jgi:hypothetical protein
MSKFDRRHMLKVMAATAAGAAASASGIENAFALSSPPTTASPLNLIESRSSIRQPASSIRSPLAAGNVALSILGQEFKPADSSFAYTRGGSVGAIQGVSGTPSLSNYRAAVRLPHGAVVTQVLFDLIVNDTNGAIVNFSAYNPETGFFPFMLGRLVTSQAATIQTLDLVGLSPLTIDAVNNAYSLLWLPGTNSSTHQLYGARVAWTLNPGLTLFPNPRRVVDGFATPFTSGITYGPFDATHQVYPIAAASGVPAGATAAFCAVQSYSSGVLTIFPDLTTDPNIANFTATADGPLSLTYMMVPLSPAGKFKIHSYITGKVSVDAWGYVV